jgi:hypothetical protein
LESLLEFSRKIPGLVVGAGMKLQEVDKFEWKIEAVLEPKSNFSF